MLNIPRIFKAPDAAGKIIGSYQAGCGYYAGHSADFTCGNFNGKCIDTTFSSTDVEGGAAVGIGIIGVIIGLIFS